MPRPLSRVGGAGAGVQCGIDLGGEVCVVGESRIDQCFGDTEQFRGPTAALLDGDITPNDGADHLLHPRTAHQDGAATGRSIAEHDQRMGLHAESLVDETLRQRGHTYVVPMGTVLQSPVQRFI